MADPTNLELFSKLLDSRIDNVNEKIELTNQATLSKIDSMLDMLQMSNDNIANQLSYIREQTTKTNGRVNKHDERIEDLYKKEANHLINCPHVEEFRTGISKMNERVNKVEEDNFIVKVFNRYPKQVLLILTFFLASTIIAVSLGLYNTYTMIKDMQKIEISEKK